MLEFVVEESSEKSLGLSAGIKTGVAVRFRHPPGVLDSREKGRHFLVIRHLGCHSFLLTRIRLLTAPAPQPVIYVLDLVKHLFQLFLRPELVNLHLLVPESHLWGLYLLTARADLDDLLGRIESFGGIADEFGRVFVDGQGERVKFLNAAEVGGIFVSPPQPEEYFEELVIVGLKL